MKWSRALGCSIFLAFLSLVPGPRAQDTTPALPVVEIGTGRAETAEPSQLSRIAPGEFVLHRSGSTAEELVVWVSLDGSATPGIDYGKPEDPIRFAPGAAETNILIGPFDDSLVEGDETVVAQLTIPPTDGLPTYAISAEHSVAKLVIHDNDVEPHATVTITHPPNGAEWPEGMDLDVNAVAIDPAGYIPTLEFFLDDVFLDRSVIAFFRAPDPGTPVNHSIVWKSPVAGKHVLVARGKDARGVTISSEPVVVVIRETGFNGTVSIVATDPEGIELPPFFNNIDAVQFEISRNGPTNRELQVFFSLHGTASKDDYFEVESRVVIPAGSSSARLQIVPKSDFLDVVEPMETVGVRLEPSQLDGPFAAYEIDPTRAQAAGVIFERTLPAEPALELVFPDRGEGFELGQPIEIVVAGYGGEEFVRAVALYDGDQQMGTSQISSDPPTAGLPSLFIRQFVWRDGTAGEHILTARATLANGQTIVSSKFLIVVKDSGVSRAHIEIAEPKEAQRFPAGSTVPITAVAVDQQGYIPRVEFYANDLQIGLSEPDFFREPDPGTPIKHSIAWENVPAGVYVLSARGIDSQGHVVISAPVKIVVGIDPPTDRVVVAVEAIDPFAAEPTADGFLDNAVFVIKRVSGPKDVEVLVMLSFSGTALNGVDYLETKPAAVIRAGSDAAEVVIEPIADKAIEGEEVVVLSVKELFCIDTIPQPPECYLIGSPGSARAVIRDNGVPPPRDARIEIVRPKSGEHFPAGADIEIAAIAADPNGYIARVEFFADDQQIGVSELAFFRAPDPGTPITHTFLWKSAPAGEYALTAKALDSKGSVGLSMPVKIVVGLGGPLGATIEITSPKSGDTFEAGVDVPVNAIAIDPNGYIPRVEFYANDRQIGVSEIAFFEAPDPGTPITHTFLWKAVPAGEYALTARGVDAQGQKISSPRVKIVVGGTGGGGDQVVLTVEAIDPFAAETTETGDVDPGVFIIRRIAGNKDVELTVNFKLSGDAVNGGDYSELKEQVVLPAGSEKVEVVVKPIPDKAIEPEEVVELTLVEPVCPPVFPPSPQCYLVGRPGSDRVLIRDSSSTADLPPKMTILPPRDASLIGRGLPFELRAEAPEGKSYVLESSTDLKTWLPVGEVALAKGQAGYAAEPDTAAGRQRYYRLRVR